MGDVSAIVAGLDVPVRTRAGFPPRGLVENADMKFPTLTLAVLGPKMVTEGILGDNIAVNRIRDSGHSTLNSFLEDPSRDMFFRMSNRFSSEIGLESPSVRKAIMRLNADGYNAGMCMLGNSIFTDAPIEKVRSLLGRGNVRAPPVEGRSRSLKECEQDIVPVHIEETYPGTAIQPRMGVVDGSERGHYVPALPEVLGIGVVAVGHLEEAVRQTSVV